MRLPRQMAALGCAWVLVLGACGGDDDAGGESPDETGATRADDQGGADEAADGTTTDGAGAASSPDGAGDEGQGDGDAVPESIGGVPSGTDVTTLSNEELQAVCTEATMLLPDFDGAPPISDMAQCTLAGLYASQDGEDALGCEQARDLCLSMPDAFGGPFDEEPGGPDEDGEEDGECDPLDCPGVSIGEIYACIRAQGAFFEEAMTASSQRSRG